MPSEGLSGFSFVPFFLFMLSYILMVFLVVDSPTTITAIQDVGRETSNVSETISHGDEVSIMATESTTASLRSTIQHMDSSASGFRCMVISDSGQKYEIDRYCPHRGADLSQVTNGGRYR